MSANINWLWGCLGRLGLEGVLEPHLRPQQQGDEQSKREDSAGQDAGQVLPGIAVVVD